MVTKSAHGNNSLSHPTCERFTKLTLSRVKLSVMIVTLVAIACRHQHDQDEYHDSNSYVSMGVTYTNYT